MENWDELTPEEKKNAKKQQEKKKRQKTQNWDEQTHEEKGNTKKRQEKKETKKLQTWDELSREEKSFVKKQQKLKKHLSKSWRYETALKDGFGVEIDNPKLLESGYDSSAGMEVIQKTVVFTSKTLMDIGEKHIDAILEHEIGHFKMGHYHRQKNYTFSQEFEADLYAVLRVGEEKVIKALEATCRAGEEKWVREIEEGMLKSNPEINERLARKAAKRNLKTEKNYLALQRRIQKVKEYQIERDLQFEKGSTLNDLKVYKINNFSEGKEMQFIGDNEIIITDEFLEKYSLKEQNTLLQFEQLAFQYAQNKKECRVQNGLDFRKNVAKLAGTLEIFDDEQKEFINNMIEKEGLKLKETGSLERHCGKIEFYDVKACQNMTGIFPQVTDQLDIKFGGDFFEMNGAEAELLLCKYAAMHCSGIEQGEELSSKQAKQVFETTKAFASKINPEYQKNFAQKFNKALQREVQTIKNYSHSAEEIENVELKAEQISQLSEFGLKQEKRERVANVVKKTVSAVKDFPKKMFGSAEEESKKITESSEVLLGQLEGYEVVLGTEKELTTPKVEGNKIVISPMYSQAFKDELTFNMAVCKTVALEKHNINVATSLKPEQCEAICKTMKEIAIGAGIGNEETVDKLVSETLKREKVVFSAARSLDNANIPKEQITQLKNLEKQASSSIQKTMDGPQKAM